MKDIKLARFCCGVFSAVSFICAGMDLIAFKFNYDFMPRWVTIMGICVNMFCGITGLVLLTKIKERI